MGSLLYALSPQTAVAMQVSSGFHNKVCVCACVCVCGAGGATAEGWRPLD